MSSSPYDYTSRPSTLLDAAHGSPLETNNLYILSVYDQERVPVDQFSLASYDTAGWVNIGLAYFSADHHSFCFADHTISTVNWNEALHRLSWSDAHGDLSGLPVGFLHFSDDLQSFLGIVASASGQERTIAGVRIMGYHTKRVNKDDVASDSYDFFFGAVSGGALNLDPFCQLWEVDGYDDREGHGFKCDISIDAHFTGKTESNSVNFHGTGNHGQVSFDIEFKENSRGFEGTLSNGSEKVFETWMGTSFEVPANIRKHIEDCLKKRAKTVHPEVRDAYTSDLALMINSPSPSHTIDIYLPATTFKNPPPYFPRTFLANVAKETGMSELKLWQISSIIRRKEDSSGEWITTDIVQNYVAKASYRIFMASLPNSVKAKFQFTDPYLLSEEKAIMKKYAEFNKAASIPFFAQALHGSPAVTPSQKNQINEAKIKAWFSAMGSLQPPKDGKPDPVIEAGLKRDDNLKALQKAYSAQMDDLYGLYYKLKVADFQKYCADQLTARKWFDKLKIYVESDTFVRQWISWNSGINSKDGSRQILEASVKFRILEDIGFPDSPEKGRQTLEIIKTLASSAAMASYSTSVNYDPTFETALKDLLRDLENSEEEEIKIKYPESAEEFQELQQLLQAYGEPGAFSNWFLRILRHYGTRGKEGFLTSVQLAGSQITDIWSKITKGKSKEDVIAQFGRTIFELAEEPMKNKANWEKISVAWRKFKGGVKSVFSHLAVAGAAIAIVAVAANKWDAVDTGIRIYLGLEAFKYALHGLKLFATTALGKLIKTRLLDNKAFLQRVGEWFGEKGIPKDIPGASILGKLIGKNVKVFLERFGAVLAVASLIVSAFDFKNALDSGKPTDIASSAISLVLAIIDVAVVATGIIAKLAGASAVAACAGPIGLVLTVVGLVVAIVFFILELSHSDPLPDPIQDFIDDELDRSGFKKK